MDVHTSRSIHTLPTLISRELDRLAVDVAALSEMRLLDKGKLHVDTTFYTQVVL